MIKSLFARQHPSLTTLLARADDHLLDDIGLTRFDIEALINAPAPVARKLRFTAAQA